jgi:hypothetical protein
VCTNARWKSGLIRILLVEKNMKKTIQLMTWS